MLTVSLHLPKALQTSDKAIINFFEWKDFYKYFHKECQKETKYTMVISNLSIRTRVERSVVKGTANAGYWIVELLERN